MGAIFKPTPLVWEDLAGGMGAKIIEEIDDFICEYCYSDEPVQWANDEDLATALTFFAEAWERVNGQGWSNEVSDPRQTAAVLSIINGAFYTSMAGDEIKEKLTKSATKPQLADIFAHVSSAYCQYVSLKARVEIEKSKGDVREGV